MYTVGDKVVHPMHGAGIIEDIVQEKVAGAYHDYYVFKMPMNGLVLKIPTTNVDLIGIRPIDSSEKIEAVFTTMPKMTFEMKGNWNQRYHENMGRLKTGDLMEVAAVIKGLMERDSRHGLSGGEKKMLAIAKEIMISEVSLAENTAYDAVEERINQAVTHSV